MNINYDGRWNAEDSEVLSNLMNNGNFDAQEAHDKLRNMAIRRYRDFRNRQYEAFQEKV
jgi:hypothetical protein